MDKQVKLFTCFLIFVLVAESASLSFGSAKVGAGNFNSIVGAIPTVTPTITDDPTPAATGPVIPSNFSIMQITDTQFLSSTYPDLYNSLCTWIFNNSGTYNLKMVVHTGDIVDQYYDSYQWVNANASMNILTKGGVPYCWCAGNHDQDGFSDPNSGWVGNQYSAFNANSFKNMSYWVSDDIQGKNTAVKFSVENYNFLIIDLESMANDTAMLWAIKLLNTYSAQNYNIIVGTHAFLNQQGGFDNGLPQDTTWETNFQNMLNNYPNVFMTLNGHAGDTRLSFHNTINGRTQIHWDWQTPDNHRGACAVRVYTFNLNTAKVFVTTYSVKDNQWYDNSLGNNFTFSPNLTSFPMVSISPTFVRMDVGQSQTFICSVSGGAVPYSYQWYRNGTAVSGATGSNWAFTPAQTGQYNIYVNVTDNLNNKAQSNIVNDITVYNPPSVSISPTSAKITLGGSQQFNSTVSGGALPYTYQWYSNNTAGLNATSPTWAFTPNSTGTYNIYLNVSDNSNYRAQSNNATINVYSQPTVTISPTSVNMTVGGTQQFNSSAVGGLIPYTYQWYYANGTAISGATTASLAYKANFTGTFIIYLNVTDSLNFKTQSNMATINIYSQPFVTISPTSVNMTISVNQQFTPTVTGGLSPYTYQWYLNGSKVPNATGSAWMFNPTSAGTYVIYLRITDSLTSVAQSNDATATVETPMNVTISPTQVKIYLGQSCTFNSSVSGGTSPYSYQWYLNGTAVSGATRADWNFTPTSAGSYWVYLNVTDALTFKVQSNIVTDIIVYSQVTVSIIPASVNMTVGTPQTFSSTVSGGALPYSYQWYLNGSQVPNATGGTWMFTPNSIGTYNIYLNVTDSLATTVQSNNATTRVETSMNVTISPTQVKMYVGQSQVFNSTVSGGSQPYSYQWYLNDTAQSGATNSTWTFIPIAAGTYKDYLNVTDALNLNALSNIVTDITVYPQLTASITPVSLNITVGTPQTFNSTVTGGATPYSYQWYLNDTAVLGANSSSWTFDATSAGTYMVSLTVTDNLTAITQSNRATVRVKTEPMLALEAATGWYWINATVVNSVATGDVDGDGQVEIVTAGCFNDGLRNVAQLIVWNSSSLAPELLTTWYWTGNTTISSVAVGDVDGDGQNEIVTGGSYFDGIRQVAQLVVWSGSSLAVEGIKTWYWTGNTVINSVALGDVDGDGQVEIVTGGYYNDGTRNIAQLVVWSGSSLAVDRLSSWYWTGNTVINSVALGDVDGDGQVEIVTGGSYFDGSRNVAQLAEWSGLNLSVDRLTGWYWTNNTAINSVAVGDVDNDSQTEIVTGGTYFDGTRNVAQLVVWVGSSLSVDRLTAWYWTGDTTINSVALGDVNGDGQVEVVTGGGYFDGTRNNAQLVVWSGSNLAAENIKTWYWTSNTAINTLAIGDVNNDFSKEIVTGGAFYDGSRSNSQLTVWGMT